MCCYELQLNFRDASGSNLDVMHPVRVSQARFHANQLRTACACCTMFTLMFNVWPKTLSNRKEVLKGLLRIPFGVSCMTDLSGRGCATSATGMKPESVSEYA